MKAVKPNTLSCGTRTKMNRLMYAFTAKESSMYCIKNIQCTGSTLIATSGWALIKTGNYLRLPKGSYTECRGELLPRGCDATNMPGWEKLFRVKYCIEKEIMSYSTFAQSFMEFCVRNDIMIDWLRFYPIIKKINALNPTNITAKSTGKPNNPLRVDIVLPSQIRGKIGHKAAMLFMPFAAE